MDLKISQLSEYDSVKDFYTVCFQNNTTVKYNLGTLESKVNSIVNACGIEEFDSTKTYQVGDFCLYEGNAYKFIFTHTGAWNSSHVTQTTAIDEILALTEVEDKQETTFLVTSNDPNLDLSEKVITINVEGETNPRIVSTDSTGIAIVNIPRDKTFSATLGSLTGYTTTSSTLNSKTLSDSSTLSFRYYKETSQRTFTVYLTVSGTNANINDFVGKNVYCFLDDLKTLGIAQLSLDTLDPTKASAEITWNESTALSGTIIYPNVDGYSLGQDITTTKVEFQSDATNTTLNYIREQ
jgi:VCBS repeat-containing protein